MTPTTSTPDAPLLARHEPNPDLHAVYARTAAGDLVRVTDPCSWQTAQNEWNHLDGARRNGYLPHVRHFEVRSLADPKYRDAPLSLLHAHLTTGGRGFKTEMNAARAAWKRFAPTFRDDGVEVAEQGRGGWFYWPNGRTAAQGLKSLTAHVVRPRGMVVQGGDGRWYVTT